MITFLQRAAASLRCDWKQCLFQSLMAAAGVFFALLVLTIDRAVIVASIGASAFIVFAVPHALTANSRHVVGGHLIGIIIGSAFSLIPHQDHSVLAVLVYATSVGLTMFLMVITGTEHPPAAGTALGIAISGFTPAVALTMLVSVAGLALIHHFFEDYLIDLC